MGRGFFSLSGFGEGRQKIPTRTSTNTRQPTLTTRLHTRAFALQIMDASIEEEGRRRPASLGAAPASSSEQQEQEQLQECSKWSMGTDGWIEAANRRPRDSIGWCLGMDGSSQSIEAADRATQPTHSHSPHNRLGPLRGRVSVIRAQHSSHLRGGCRRHPHLVLHDCEAALAAATGGRWGWNLCTNRGGCLPVSPS